MAFPRLSKEFGVPAGLCVVGISLLEPDVQGHHHVEGPGSGLVVPGQQQPQVHQQVHGHQLLVVPPLVVQRSSHRRISCLVH